MLRNHILGSQPSLSLSYPYWGPNKRDCGNVSYFQNLTDVRAYTNSWWLSLVWSVAQLRCLAGCWSVWARNIELLASCCPFNPLSPLLLISWLGSSLPVASPDPSPIISMRWCNSRVRRFTAARYVSPFVTRWKRALIYSQLAQRTCSSLFVIKSYPCHSSELGLELLSCTVSFRFSGGSVSDCCTTHDPLCSSDSAFTGRQKPPNCSSYPLWCSGTWNTKCNCGIIS